MAFHLFKKKKEEEIPEDVGFETPPTLANPAGNPPNQQLPNFPPMNPPNPSRGQLPNFPPANPPTQPTPTPSPYPVEITRPPQPAVSPQIEEEVKLLSTKIESINVRLNTLSQKLDYLINLLRQRYQV